MGTFAQYKERRPADPALVQQYKEEMVEELKAFKLQQLRKEMGLTQTELADEIGVSQVRVSALERGRVDDLLIKTLQQYAHALGGRLRVELELNDQVYTIA